MPEQNQEKKCILCISEEEVETHPSELLFICDEHKEQITQGFEVLKKAIRDWTKAVKKEFAAVADFLEKNMPDESKDK